jgi:hypothetical protein
MVDPITATETPVYTTFTVLSTDDPKTEPTPLTERKGVAFRNASSADTVWECNADGSESFTLEAGDVDAQILDYSQAVLFYFMTSSPTATIERKEWM